jgi:predicted nucleic acid-binding protein
MERGPVGTPRACVPRGDHGVLGHQALIRFADGTLGIDECRPDGLTAEAWRIASDLGWAKTYDAEYLASANLLGCRVLTLDMRLRRGAERLGLVVRPAELAERG